jgi:hypothetical protein
MSEADADPGTFARAWLERGLADGTLLIGEAELPAACFDLSTGLLGGSSRPV